MSGRSTSLPGKELLVASDWDLSQDWQWLLKGSIPLPICNVIPEGCGLDEKNRQSGGNFQTSNQM
jgi:hypothetical protein